MESNFYFLKNFFFFLLQKPKFHLRQFNLATWEDDPFDTLYHLLHALDITTANTSDDSKQPGGCARDPDD